MRYAFRLLFRQRVFTLALTTLALGIGANSAIFAVVNAVLLRPLPFRNPGRVVLIEEVIKKVSPQGMAVTPSDLIEYQRSSQAFESVAGYTITSVDLTGTGEPERLQGFGFPLKSFPFSEYLRSSVEASLQRKTVPDSGVAVISYPLWQRRFGGDPGVAGRVVDFDRQPTTIVGVLPKGFEFPLPGLPFGGGQDVWVPLGLTQEERSHWQLQLTSWLPDSSLE